MIMDCSKYTGKCSCGKEHELETKLVVVEYNAIANFEKYMEQVGLAGSFINAVDGACPRRLFALGMLRPEGYLLLV